MTPKPSLLVVDDEEVVCQSCVKVLEGQGFKVEAMTDACKALDVLTKNAHQYAAILLDLMLPGFDGLQLLRELRSQGKTTPVIVITGYPSVDSAAQAMRLGAADYVPKPFTPAEIIAAVSRTLESQRAPSQAPAAPASLGASSLPQGGSGRPSAVPTARPPLAPRPTVGPFAPSEEPIRFVGESWFALGKDGTARVGVLYETLRVRGTQGLILPAQGDTILLGLPMAAVEESGGTLVPFFAPISGEVLEVSPPRPGASTLVGDLASTSWILRVRPTALDTDLARATPRTVVLVTTDDIVAQKERQRLAALGCRVAVARSAEEALAALPESGPQVLFVDAPSMGDRAPALVREAVERVPSLRVLVADGPKRTGEPMYAGLSCVRMLARPAQDADFAQAVCGSFVVEESPREEVAAPKASRPVRRIRLTGRNGSQVALLADQGLLEERRGVGEKLIHAILEEAFPLLIGLGSEPLQVTRILEEAAECDRLFVLRAENMGRIPGTVLKDRSIDVVQQAGAAASKITTLTIEPPRGNAQQLVYGGRTDAAVARFLLEEMTL